MPPTHPPTALPAVSVDGSNATVLIQENGNPSGVVQFNTTSYSAMEGDSMFVLLERVNRTLGDVSSSNNHHYH